MRVQRIDIYIACSPSRVWDVMRDVVRWSDWTAKKVLPLGSARIEIGNHFSIVQPRLKPQIWTVTQLHPGKSFSWQTRKSGVVLTARHEIEIQDGGSRVSVRLEFGGGLGGAVACLTRNSNFRHLRMEAAGLKAYCEHSSADHQHPSTVKRECLA